MVEMWSRSDRPERPRHSRRSRFESRGMEACITARNALALQWFTSHPSRSDHRRHSDHQRRRFWMLDAAGYAVRSWIALATAFSFLCPESETDITTTSALSESSIQYRASSIIDSRRTSLLAEAVNHYPHPEECAQFGHV